MLELVEEKDNYLTVETELVMDDGTTATDWTRCEEPKFESLAQAVNWLENRDNGYDGEFKVPNYKFPKGKNKVYFNDTLLGIHEVI